MKRLLALALLLSGCSRLFGLEPPVRGDDDDDAAIGTDDGRLDSMSVSDGALRDAPPDTTALPATCPSTYNIVVVNGTKYRLVTANMSWDNAQATCLADQPPNSSRYTHLAVITSSQEVTVVQAVLNGETFVGLSDRVTEGTYTWVTAETTTFPPATGAPWGTNEPQASAAADCVIEATNGTLKVVDCGNNRDFICECDAYAADPSRY